MQGGILLDAAWFLCAEQRRKWGKIRPVLPVETYKSRTGPL